MGPACWSRAKRTGLRSTMVSAVACHSLITPVAAMLGDPAVCEFLLSEGADPTAVDSAGCTPSGRAKNFGHASAAALLGCPARWMTERLLWLGHRDPGSLLRSLPPELICVIAEKRWEDAMVCLNM